MTALALRPLAFAKSRNLSRIPGGSYRGEDLGPVWARRRVNAAILALGSVRAETAVSTVGMQPRGRECTSRSPAIKRHSSRCLAGCGFRQEVQFAFVEQANGQ